LGQGITTGTVLGTVADPSGALIPGAQIQLKSVAAGLILTGQSGKNGSFMFLAVPIGTYKAVITAQGFSIYNIENIAVNAGATTDLGKVALKLGAVEQVEVNGSAASLLEASDSQVTTTFGTETMQNLPLNNGFDTVTELIPGVVSTGADNFSNANGDNYSVNGQSGRYNNFEIDGQSNNDNSIGGPQVFFGSQDAIQEIQVITNGYSAQYGRNAGAIENYITKSGTNAFHGSAFDLYQGQFLSSMTNNDKSPLFGYCPAGVSPASGCAAPVLPRFVENRYGGTVGGPILRNKLFFFFSTYWDKVRMGASPSASLPSLTPDATGLATIKSTFSADPGAATILGFGPYSIAQGAPKPIPVSAAECPGTYTAAGTCLEFVRDGTGASASVEVAGVQRTIASIFNDQEELARVDWQPTAKDHLFVRYYYQPMLYTGYAGATGIASGDFVDVPSTTHSIGADWTHLFTTHFVDQLRYSFQEAKAYFEGGAYPNCVVTNLGACPAQVNFTGTDDDSGFGGDITYPQGRTVKVTQVQNNATWTHGAQTMLFGGEFDYQNSPNAGIYYYNGYPNYSSLGNLLGSPDPSLGGAPGYSYLANGIPVIPFTEPDVAAYFQDDWKALPTLTVHIGMRWEFFSQAVNKLHQETVARESNPATAIWYPSLPLANRTVPAASQVYTNFEPRIGLAWNPDFDKKLVVRAGYAINANPAFYNMFLLIADGAPMTNLGAFYCGSNACLPSNGSILSSDFRATNLPSLPTGDPGQDVEMSIPSSFRTPYVQTYTLGIEHQLGGAAVMEVRYVGAKTTDDFQSIDGNPELLPVAAAFPNLVSASSLCQDPAADGYGRPNCNFSNVSNFTNGGWANYNALELNLTTQRYHGLTSTWSYTRSKAMNNATDAVRSTGGGGSTIAYPQNPLAPDAPERGLSGNDFPNTVGIGFTYDLPKLVKENNLLGRAANGFRLSGLYRYRSGQDYTPYQPLDLDPNTGDSSFCDGSFNGDVIGVDTCRLVLSNKNAPVNTVAYLNPYVTDPSSGAPVAGSPHYIVYNSDGYDQTTGNYLSGTPADPTKSRWIINNQAYALAVNNPYPGSSRSLVRGQPFSDLDLTIAKAFPITERVSLQLSMAAYNALNQMFLGVGNPYVAASNFTSNAENASGSASGETSGNRFVILGGKVIF
jgi:hypothetical protein